MPKELPIQEIIIATENLIKTASIPAEIPTHMRNTVITGIEKRKPMKSNLSTKEWKAIKKIIENNEQIAITADKGHKSIMMDYGMEATEQKEA